MGIILLIVLLCYFFDKLMNNVWCCNMFDLLIYNKDKRLITQDMFNDCYDGLKIVERYDYMRLLFIEYRYTNWINTKMFNNCVNGLESKGWYDSMVRLLEAFKDTGLVTKKMFKDCVERLEKDGEHGCIADLRKAFPQYS